MIVHHMRLNNVNVHHIVSLYPELIREIAIEKYYSYNVNGQAKTGKGVDQGALAEAADRRWRQVHFCKCHLTPVIEPTTYRLIMCALYQLTFEII